MRNSETLHPEWGYFAPTRSFIRTARAVVVATVVGAIAGGILVAWVSHSGTETSVAARTLVDLPVKPAPAPRISSDHVVHAINPSRGEEQSALAPEADRPSAKEITTEFSASSTPDASTGKASPAAKPAFAARLPRMAHSTPVKKPASRTSSPYASRHEPTRVARGEHYMRRSSDEYRASDARGGYYRESGHWSGYYGGGERAYGDW